MSLRGLFITGTDTGVGKTWVAAAIVRILAQGGHAVGALKPVQTGAPASGAGDSDAEILMAALGQTIDPRHVAPLQFAEPVAPPVAARRQGDVLDYARVLAAVDGAVAWWVDRAEVVVVEGVGGLLCPLAEEKTVADLVVDLDFPLLIVARRGLGTLNHALLTLEAAHWRGLRVAGVVLNAAERPQADLADASNPAELVRRLGRVPLLAVLDHVDDLSTLSIGLDSVDWYERAALPRHDRKESRAHPLGRAWPDGE